MKAKLTDISFKIGDTLIPIKNTFDIHIHGEGGMTAIEYSGNPPYPHQKIKHRQKTLRLLLMRNSV